MLDPIDARPYADQARQGGELLAPALTGRQDAGSSH